MFRSHLHTITNAVANSVANAMLDAVYPPACLGCDQLLADPALRSPHQLCDRCRPSTLELFQNAAEDSCPVCGGSDPTVRTAERCLPCRLVPMGATSVRSLWTYQQRVEPLLKRYKYSWQPRLAQYLAQELSGYIRQTFELNAIDLLLAVPSSPASLRKRGFHHLGELTRIVGAELNLPVDLLALRATRKQEAQAMLSPLQRSANVAEAFTASTRRISGKRLLLLDDVLTSGSTISAVCHLIRAAGAADISVCTLARSPNFDHLRRVLVASLKKTHPRSTLGVYRQSSQQRAGVRDIP